MCYHSCTACAVCVFLAFTISTLLELSDVKTRSRHIKSALVYNQFLEDFFVWLYLYWSACALMPALKTRKLANSQTPKIYLSVRQFIVPLAPQFSSSIFALLAPTSRAKPVFENFRFHVDTSAGIDTWGAPAVYNVWRASMTPRACSAFGACAVSASSCRSGADTFAFL